MLSHHLSKWLVSEGAESDLADAVAEAIFRHTDFNGGKISSTGQLIQLGTLFGRFKRE
jgi:cyanamide hydratase